MHTDQHDLISIALACAGSTALCSCTQTKHQLSQTQHGKIFRILTIPTKSTTVCQQSHVASQVLSRQLRLSGDFDFQGIAKLTPGFVGADLAALLKEAAAMAVSRIFKQLETAQLQQSPQVAVNGLANMQRYAPVSCTLPSILTCGEKLVAPLNAVLLGLLHRFFFRLRTQCFPVLACFLWQTYTFFQNIANFDC